MTVLEWLFYGGLIVGLCLFLLAILFLALYISRKRELKSLTKETKKNKQKRHKLNKRRKNLQSASNRLLAALIIALFVGGLVIGIGVYARYYQSVNLSGEDSDAVAKGYFLLNDLEQQLKDNDPNQKEDAVQLQRKKTIDYLATSLANYGVQSADSHNSTEGQLLLNRYYTYLSELGKNVNNQANEILEDSDVANEFLSDLKKVRNRQQKVFEYYKVNENNLKENK